MKSRKLEDYRKKRHKKINKISFNILLNFKCIFPRKSIIFNNYNMTKSLVYGGFPVISTTKTKTNSKLIYTL